MSAYDILVKRGVTRLCHFTKLKNFIHIITSDEGILASKSIRQDIKEATDVARYDGELEYVCCSVQYPNSWFLNKVMEKNSDSIFKDFVVLYIDLSILKYNDAKFCPCNASKGKGKYISDKMENIDSIFARSISTFNYLRPEKMLSCCPTDGQAEILIKNNIPKNYITGVATGNEDVGKRVYAMLETCGINKIPIYIAPDVLTKKWSDMVKFGSKPAEIECDWSKEVKVCPY